MTESIKGSRLRDREKAVRVLADDEVKRLEAMREEAEEDDDEEEEE